MVQEGWLEPNLIGRIVSPVIGRMMRRRILSVANEVREYVVTSRA